jgi:hypothetical protein
MNDEQELAFGAVDLFRLETGRHDGDYLYVRPLGVVY